MRSLSFSAGPSGFRPGLLSADVAFRRARRDSSHARKRRAGVRRRREETMTSRYRQTYDRWRADPQGFWAEAAARDRLDNAAASAFSMPRPASTAAGFPTRAATPASTRSTGMSRPGAATRRAPSTTAPSPGPSARITLSRTARRDGDARRRAARFRRRARATGCIIYMPMIPEAIVAMLACARIGAVHSVVFGGFAAKELATRIDDAEPKLILTASLRRRAGPDRRVQAAARSRDRARPAQAGGLRRLPAPADRSAA